MLLIIFISHFKLLYLFSFFSIITKLTIIKSCLSHIINIIIAFNSSWELWITLFYNVFNYPTILFWRYVYRTLNAYFFNLTKIIKLIQRSFFLRRNIILPFLFFNSFLCFFSCFSSKTLNNVIYNLLFINHRLR
jgi:hypothetical protein